MATFLISTDKNIDELSGKAGADTYQLDRSLLTVDQDSRYGLNTTPTTGPLGHIRNATALGGNILFDARKVRLIPFNNGSGTIPALNTLITQGSASGKLTAVYTALNATPLTSGSMPASGWLKVKQWNDVAYAAGALSGVTADATGSDVVGWIEIVGVETYDTGASNFSNIYLLGEWYDLGLTSGVVGQQFQIPTNGSNTWIAGVFVEKSIGSGTFDFYGNVGTLTTFGTEEERGFVCWITTGGVVTLGHNGATASGHTPSAGRRVVIGNIIVQNTNATVGYAQNCQPHATMGTRYSFGTSGCYTFDKVCFSCEFYTNSGGGNTVTNSAFLDQIYMPYTNGGITFTNNGICQMYYAASWSTIFAISFSYFNLTVEDNTFITTRSESGLKPHSISNTYDFLSFKNNRCMYAYPRIASNVGGSSLSLLYGGALIDNNLYISCFADINSATGITASNFKFIDTVSGVTTTANLMRVAAFTRVNNSEIHGLTFPLVNNNCYGYAFNLDACVDTTVHSIGTFSSPLNLGTTVKTDGIVSGGNNVRVKYKRIFTTEPRSYVLNPSSAVGSGGTIEHCGNCATYTKSLKTNTTNALKKGYFGVVDDTDNAPGDFIIDGFHSATTGTIEFNPSVMIVEGFSSDYIRLNNTPAAIMAPHVGSYVEYETPYFVLGHTGFRNIDVPAYASWPLTKYAIDKNDGNGWSVWKSATGANLSAETGIDPTLGFKVKLRIESGTENTNSWHGPFTTFYTTCTIESQQIFYPLFVSTLKINSVVSGSTVKVQKVSDSSVLYTGTASQMGIEYAGSVLVTVRKGTGSPTYKEWQTITTLVSDTTVEITALQELDE
jgi:hypothetical protein